MIRFLFYPFRWAQGVAAAIVPAIFAHPAFARAIGCAPVVVRIPRVESGHVPDERPA